MTRKTSVGTVCQRFADTYTYAGVSSPYINTVSPLTVSTLTRSDIVVNKDDGTGWRKPSPYDVTLTASEPGYCEMWMDNPSNMRYFRQIGKLSVNTPGAALNISSAYLNSNLPSINDLNIAVIKARNNVADRVASFGESLAELVKTLSGLGDLASQIDQFIDAAMKKDYRKVADSLGVPRKSRKHRRAVIRYNKLGIPTVSNAFLCWNFGLSPIISDMVSLAILMGEGKPLRVTGKGLYAPPALNGTGILSTGSSMPYSGATFTIHQRQVRKAGAYARLDYEVSFEALRSLTSYGLMDAPATLWAVAPYSFLVDFVLPVSEVLRSLTATHGLSFKGGSGTRFYRDERKFSHTTQPVDTKTLKVHTWRVTADDMRGLRMVRSVYKTDPNPITLWVKDPLSAFSVATVFSLLGQKLGKLRFS